MVCYSTIITRNWIPLTCQHFEKNNESSRNHHLDSCGRQMAVDTFLRICQKCKKKFVIQQAARNSGNRNSLVHNHEPKDASSTFLECR